MEQSSRHILNIQPTYTTHLVSYAGLTNQVEAAKFNGVMVAKEVEEPFVNQRFASLSSAPTDPVEVSSTKKHYIRAVHLPVICTLSYFEMTQWLMRVTAL